MWYIIRTTICGISKPYGSIRFGIWGILNYLLIKFWMWFFSAVFVYFGKKEIIPVLLLILSMAIAKLLTSDHIPFFKFNIPIFLCWRERCFAVFFFWVIFAYNIVFGILRIGFK